MFLLLSPCRANLRRRHPLRHQPISVSICGGWKADLAGDLGGKWLLATVSAGHTLMLQMSARL